MKTLNAIIPFFALISAIPAFAGIPDAVTYAGTLNQGSAPANGTFTVVFDLFDAEAAGNRVFGQTEASLAVSQGQLVVDLGDDPLNPLSDEVLKGGSLFLDITVNGETLSPRVPFTAVPFARVAKQAEHASDADTIGGLGVDDVLNVLQAEGGVQRIGDKFSLAPGGVTAANMAASSVNSGAIVDGTIVSGDLANNSVVSAKIADGNVGNSKLALGSITTEKITNLQITTLKLADHAVTAVKVDGVKLFVEPAGCGSGLVLKRVVGQTKCHTETCSTSVGHYERCDGSCDETRTTPNICDVSDNDGDEAGVFIAR